MTVTSRADEHDKDVMVQLMFGTLNPPEDKARLQGHRCYPRSTARPKGRLLVTTAARAGGADPSWKE